MEDGKGGSNVMFEKYEFDYLMNRMLSRVDNGLDKREGAVIYDALAPAALELANFYIALDMVLNEVFADSASYYFLSKRAAERGLYPKEETCAVGKMVVSPSDCIITPGARFHLDGLNYGVASAIEEEKGAYRVICETPGTIGNQQLGDLLPVEYQEGMETACLTEILIPGEEEEDVEAFRERYFESFRNKAFGGNKADYIEKVSHIQGVGGCKIIRSWNGGLAPSDLVPGDAAAAWFENQSPQSLGTDVYPWLEKVYAAAREGLLTVGGKVKVLLITSDFKPPSAALTNMVQQILDPEEMTGEGEGLVPIGHVVKVGGVRGITVNFRFHVTYEDGYGFSNRKESMEAAIDSYFLTLSREWASSASLTVRISQVETLLLSLKGVIDIGDTEINGKKENLKLEGDCIPVRGELVG